jgi:hypothetical protein
MQGTNETTERTVLDELVARRRELWAERSEVEAQLHEIEAEIAKVAPPNLDAAEWHRLAAIAQRERTPEAQEAADKQWLLMMARSHMKRGSRPDMGDHRQAEIDATMDDLLRAESIQ